MNKKTWERKPSRQIAIHKGKKGLLEFENCMMPPSVWFPWHLHAEGGKDEEKASLIRLVMVDYSDRDNTVSVYANLRPSEIKWLHHQILQGVDVSFSQQKIFREDKRSNNGKVTYLSINRYETDPEGKKREQPWRIEIQNGTGVAASNSIGGQYCKKGSYRKKKGVTLYLNDADVFMLFSDVVTVIRACEREHLFHGRDVENLKKLLHFSQSNAKSISDSLQQIIGLLGKPGRADDGRTDDDRAA